MRITLVSLLLCCYFINITHASIKCLDDQQYLLLQFKNNLTFYPPFSNKLKYWNQSTACCFWSGVTCDNEGHVIGLDLSEEWISGGFNNSSSLFSIQNLQKLNLAYNNFNCLIPSGFSKLEKLTYLNLSYAGFQGQIPIEISQLTRLVTLDLSFDATNISNLQKFIQNLTNIRKLYLDGISITSRGHEWINALLPLRDLQELSMSYCGLSGPLDSSLSKLENLSVILLDYNNFLSPVPQTFANFKNLTFFSLRCSGLTGTFPRKIFQIGTLSVIDLTENYNLHGSFPEFQVSGSLRALRVRNTSFSGEIPNSMSNLIHLKFLDISYNRLNGSLQLDELLKLRNLTALDLSYNNLSINVNNANAYLTSFPNITLLRLASCNLKTFPNFLRNQSSLKHLDVSENQIQGVVPNWIWKLQSLEVLNISHNFLTELEGSLQNITSNVVLIDLHNNQLQGSIPVFPKSVEYLDYSTNKFSVIPHDIGNYLSSAYFLSLSHNNLQGSIPLSLCNASNLQVLDLSFNNIYGTLYPCLVTMTSNLEVLNLRMNNLIGPIPDLFPEFCVARTLNFHGNLLHGPIPKSLSHCSILKVLDIGSNQIVGGFPCFLKNLPNLSVLVLRNNKLHGPIECSLSLEDKPWNTVQIFDIALNNFNGKLPENYFTTWERMMQDEDDDVILDFFNIDQQTHFSNYQDIVTVSNKGQQMELVKILTIFASIDFSTNHFEGQIPEVLMQFKAIHVLNFSNNCLSGEIPSSIENLKQLESLDLSNNSLVGEIPVQLASLSFLSYLNLSFNHLAGKIPTGTQLQSFEASSFEGNDGLYGPPLNVTQDGKRQDLHPQPACGRITCSIDCNFLSVELGFVFGLGTVICPIMFWKQWRVRYWKLVDKTLCWIFSRIHLEYATDRGQTYTILRW